MRLVVDGEIFTRQTKGGISRIFIETLPRLCDVDPGLTAVILTDGALRQPLPRHAQILHRAIPRYEWWLRPGRLFRPAAMALKQRARVRLAGPAAGAVWQASYYSTPPAAWQGLFAVIFHDLMEERYAEMFVQPRHELVRRRKRACALQADIVICNSPTTQQDVCAFYGLPLAKTRLITLAPGSHFRVLAKEERIPTLAPPRPYLLYVGERSAYKNFALLLTAYAAWPGRADLDLAVVGRPWDAAEWARVQALGLADQVRHYAFADDAALCQLYNAAAAFVYPSLFEGFGLPPLEAMACGCPVVASDIPTTRGVAGDHPFYFAAQDAADLRRALDAALAQGREQLRQDAAQQHAASYSWQTTARQLSAIYHELVGEPSTA